MSPLTKLFVVLQVVFSLLISSAAVVYVNTHENLNAQLTTAKQQLQDAQVEKQNAQTAAAAQRELAQEASRNAQTQIEQSRQASNQIQQRMNEQALKNAELTATLALQSADLTRVTEALKAAQNGINQKDEQIAQLRQSGDQRLQQNVELNTALTTTTSTLEVTERERRYLAEQLAELKRTADRQAGIIKDAGINNPMMASAGNAAGAPPINGVVRTRRDIGGRPYASISVGSNDGVAKGMEFKVIDRSSNKFLGVLVVDSVSDTDATGRLSGPFVNEIRAGSEVKTQL